MRRLPAKRTGFLSRERQVLRRRTEVPGLQRGEPAKTTASHRQPFGAVFSSSRQCARPVEVVVGAQAFHKQNSAKHVGDEQQHFGGEYFIKQRHVGLYRWWPRPMPS